MDGIAHDDFSFSSRLTTCPACGSHALSAWSPSVGQSFSVAGFAHDICEDCGTIFTNPRPTGDSLSDFYSRVEGKDDQAIVAASLRYYTDEGRRAARVRDYLNPLLERKPGGKLLDFGCGAGWFAALARDAGYEVEGIEQMPAAVAAAREELGLEGVRVGTEADLPETPTYDVIVCNNLIEHLIDPKGFAERVAAALNPGGLWMVNYPSASAEMFKAFGPHSYYFMTPYHLTHFTRKGFDRFVRRVGLSAIDVLPQTEAFYWARGLASRLGLSDRYEAWREEAAFVQFDIALDELLTSLALKNGVALNELCFVAK